MMGGKTTMGAPELQKALSLLEGTAAVIFLIALIALVLVRRSRAKAKPEKAPMPTPEFGSAKRPETAATDAVRAPQPVAPPTRVAVPQSPTQAPQQSYAAIAAAQANGSIPRPATPPPARTVIDYTNTLTNIRPDASYTSAAIASLLGIVANAHAPTAETHAGESYAAIAARSSTLKPRMEAPSPPRIDYSREATVLPPNASYTAIAIATAAAHRH